MMGFNNLQDDQRKRVLDYKLTVYVCTGSPSEKLLWFRRINIAGYVLTDQEIRNAVYHGSFVSDAKRYFSKNACAAYSIAKDYVSGSPIRQDFPARCSARSATAAKAENKNSSPLFRQYVAWKCGSTAAFL